MPSKPLPPYDEAPEKNHPITITVKVPGQREPTPPPMQQFAAPRLPQRRASSLFPAALLALILPIAADPVINEIFYHEDHGINPENLLTEWIELHNPTPAAIDLSNWTFSRGVSYTFPPGTSFPANGYLVVAADTPSFNASHPGIDNGTNV
ncbi:MAG: lamin tail domain-containing protein, partial [Verrucomicrobiota bacterium]|nr:lamin tail domain-containing protein [Verrucomicrobiota bacterium]